jgi:hypothetical protein
MAVLVAVAAAVAYSTLVEILTIRVLAAMDL